MESEDPREHGEIEQNRRGPGRLFLGVGEPRASASSSLPIPVDQVAVELLIVDS